MALLSISADSKTIKGEALGFLTGILYMAPHKTIQGFNACPMADLAGCSHACLYTAGRGAFNSVQSARIKRLQAFINDQNAFMVSLVHEISALIKKASKLGFKPVVRLNGTTDIKWENISFDFNGITYTNIMEFFSDVQFYDYTKMSGRIVPANYDLTFSYSGITAFNKYNNKAIDNGMRIAVVFNGKLPESFNGMRVIDGDLYDSRFIDDKGIVIGLKAKGKARKDNSGFIIPIMKG